MNAIRIPQLQIIQDLDEQLSRIFADETDLFFSSDGDYGFGIPNTIFDRETAELSECPDCKGKGEIALLWSITECKNCSGSGMIAE